MEFIYLTIGLVTGGVSAWYLAKLKLHSTNQALQTKLDSIQQSLEENKGELVQERDKNLHLSTNLASLAADNKNLGEKLKEQKQEVEKIQEKFTIQFKNLANDLLEEKSKKFTDQNKINLENILKPLGERIIAFEKKVEQTNKESLERNVALRTEIKKLNELNSQITKEAENLTKAIKGDTKVQGEWGEFILESILEKSGLVKGREYFVQASLVTEAGKRYQPDIIVKLPEEKTIIIDAKVSLVNYEKFFNTAYEEEREVYLKKHTQSVRKHISLLSEKNYQDLYAMRGLDFVLMFIPMEPAFSLAVQHDASLFNDAYEKNIVVVSPSTLTATLRTIANIWKNEYQNQHALEIARQGGALYDKFVSFIEDLKNVGRQMDSTRKVYIEAVKKLYEGRGNLVSKAQRIKELGARTNKSLDQKLLDLAKE
ncbi:MAG: DNA recombination protein RmuC [Cytophagales bacterium]|nr:DNA recombination protein RmuC [Cytophagales bacterium]